MTSFGCSPCSYSLHIESSVPLIWQLGHVDLSSWSWAAYESSSCVHYFPADVVADDPVHGAESDEGAVPDPGARRARVRGALHQRRLSAHRAIRLSLPHPTRHRKLGRIHR